MNTNQSLVLAWVFSTLTLVLCLAVAVVIDSSKLALVVAGFTLILMCVSVMPEIWRIVSTWQDGRADQTRAANEGRLDRKPDECDQEDETAGTEQQSKGG